MLLSIIIPVYNVEDYLVECLDSIITQINNVSNIEIIVIDDGSTDNSVKICDEYGKKYPNIVKVIHKKNEGLLATRRLGYSIACGEYIVNCDSDDKLAEGALDVIFNIISECKPDVIFYNFIVFGKEKEKIIYKDYFSKNEFSNVRKDEVISDFLVSETPFVSSACGKIVKRDVIGVDKSYKKYGKLNQGEDTLQSIEIFNNSKNFVYLNKEIYMYRIENGMTTKFDENYYLDWRKIYINILENSNRWRMPHVEMMMDTKYCNIVGRSITQIRYAKKIDKRQFMKFIYDIVNDDLFKTLSLKKIINNKYVKTKYKVILVLLKIKMYRIIFLLVNR